MKALRDVGIRLDLDLCIHCKSCYYIILYIIHPGLGQCIVHPDWVTKWGGKGGGGQRWHALMSKTQESAWVYGTSDRPRKVMIPFLGKSGGRPAGAPRWSLQHSEIFPWLLSPLGCVPGDPETAPSPHLHREDQLPHPASPSPASRSQPQVWTPPRGAQLECL